MRTSITTALALAILAAPILTAGAAGAADSGSDWPAAADLVSANVAVDLSGDGVHDIWVLEIDTRRDTERDVSDVARRCRAAGLTIEECRRIIHDHHSDLAERCRNAGLTVEQCRRILSDDDQHTIAERCRAAGLTSEECRRIIGNQHGNTLAERCRAAGLTVEECRRIAGDHRDHDDRATDRVRDRATDRVPDADRPTDTVVDRPTPVRPRRVAQVDSAPTRGETD